MGDKSSRCARWCVAASVLVMVAGLTVFMSGQQGVVGNNLHVPILRNGPQEAPVELQGVVDDWSHHHLIFSNPGTEEEAIKNGRHDEWLRIVNDPRYIMQQLKRRSPAQGPAAEYVARMNELARAREATESADLAEGLSQDSFQLVKDRGPSSSRKSKIQRDWSMNMGGAAASLTGTVNNIGSGYISGSSTLVINGTTLTASAPTTEEVALTVGSILPPASSYLSIVEAGTNVEYIFEDAATVATGGSDGSDAAHTCQVRAYVHAGGDTADTVASHLYSALVTAGNGNTGTYTCNSDVTASNLTSLATITNPGGTSASFTITAKTTGSTGFGAAATSGSPFDTGAYTYTAGADGTQSSTLFPYWSGNTYLSPTDVAANIVSTILANGTLSGTFNATSNGANVIVSDKTVNSGNGLTATAGSFTGFAWGNSGTFAGGNGAVASDMGGGVYPAKYGATGTPSCSDYVAYTTGLAGVTTTVPSIVAYNNIYAGASPGCGTTGVPTVYWEYNTGGQIVTSPVISWDGTQLAFVQTVSGAAYLTILRYSSSGASIVQPTTASSASSYPNCPGPCMISIAFNGGANDTNSSPYYNYSTDTLYVGDANGELHQFINVFGGVPSELVTCGSQPCWPVAVSSGNTLSSPVYDNSTGSGKVFVGNACSSTASPGCGYLNAIPATGTPTVVQSTPLAVSPGVVTGPLVDSTAKMVYVFVGKDVNLFNSNTNSPCAPGADAACNGVFQLATNFTGSTKYGESVFGPGSSNPLYAGSFDNQYYSSTATSPTGNLYVCGLGGAGGYPKLMDATISANAFTEETGESSTTVTHGTLYFSTNIANNMTNNAAANCSPVTEIYNSSTSTDWIYLSVSASGDLTGCTGACIYSWNTTSTLTFQNTGSTITQPTQALAVTGGTSGIIIDNVSNQTGASQIYFGLLGSTTCTGNGNGQGLGSGGCAVQAAQSGL